MPTNSERCFTVAATRSGIRQAIEVFDQFRATCGLAEDDVWQVQVALDEVLVNSVDYGCAGKPDATVGVEFRFESGTVAVAVVDEGPAFDPLTLPPPDITTPIDERRPGGLGVHFVKTLMDRVQYARQDGKNRLVFSRRVRPGPAPSDNQDADRKD